MVGRTMIIQILKKTSGGRNNAGITFSFAQAGQTCQQSAVVHVSAVVWADLTLLNDSNNNEQLFINLATVMGRRIFIFPPAQSCGRKL